MEDVDKTVIGVAVSAENASSSAESIRLIAADGTEFELSGEMSIGRSDDCDITVNDSRVSRKHARIAVENGKVVLEDLGSANGTYINGQRLEGQQELSSGDGIAFDNAQFTFQVGDAPSEPEEAATDPNATMIGSAPPPAVEPPAPEPEVVSEKSVPGSWDDSQGVEGTQLMQAPDMPELSEALQSAAATADTDLPHLIISTATGNQIVELSVSADDAASVWEIGRETGCDIVVADPSVSSKHAQLVCKNGRWRMVNMVSTNGIFVNGEKKLSAYLSDGDEVQLGAVKLLFKAGANQAAVSSSASKQTTGSSTSSGMNVKAIVAVLVLVLIGAAVAFLS